MLKEMITVIPVRTFGAGNMGSILRAMKNFDFISLTAVQPLYTDMTEVERLAAGAKDHLSYLKTSDSLSTTVAECHQVYAFSARTRKGFRVISPREMAHEIASFSDTMRVGILFGNETNGLDSKEIEAADTLVVIPTSENYSSLNLASSVLLALYEIHSAMHQTVPVATDEVSTKAFREEVKEAMVDLVTEIMPSLGKTPQLNENVTAVVRKMHLTKKEARFTTNLLRMLEKKLQK